MSSSKRLAVAFDLGTTSIAASLVDLSAGKRIAVTGVMNPQRQWGADVLTRLTAASDPDTLLAMKNAVAMEMERMAEDLLSVVDGTFSDLRGIAVAGNSAMEEIALGLPVASLAHPPFRPLFTEGKSATTFDLGWSREVPAYLFPLPGGFVGGDLVAFLFGLRESAKPATLYLDIGTNAEIALFDGDNFLATSAAAGPAFEGGNLHCGMAALPGAVTSVKIEGDRLAIETVGDAPARGICGSGVLDVVSALLSGGLIDATGRLLPPEEITSNLGNRMQTVNGTQAFVLHRDASRLVYLDQDDIRALQLAKGALRGGMEILMSKAGLSFDDLSEVVLTGSFGAVLSPQVLKNIGIFTENMVRITGFVREGALAGAERLLLEHEGAALVGDLASKVRVIPLSGTPLFEKRFLENLNFPKA